MDWNGWKGGASSVLWDSIHAQYVINFHFNNINWPQTLGENSTLAWKKCIYKWENWWNSHTLNSVLISKQERRGKGHVFSFCINQVNSPSTEECWSSQAWFPLFYLTTLLTNRECTQHVSHSPQVWEANSGCTFSRWGSKWSVCWRCDSHRGRPMHQRFAVDLSVGCVGEHASPPSNSYVKIKLMLWCICIRL